MASIIRVAVLSFLIQFNCVFSQKTTYDPLDVYLIAHTHVDSTWLTTFDIYYENSVLQILQTITQDLMDDPSKKFSWSEIGYLEKWWRQDAN